MCIKAATKVLFFFLFTKSFAVFFQTANNSTEVFSENMEMTIPAINFLHDGMERTNVYKKVGG